jgi:uncharacterized protein (DUF58 family)
MVLPVAWGLLAALALVLSWVTGTAGFAWVGYAMVGVWVLAIAAARLGQRGITVSRTLSADCLAFGGRVRVDVVVANSSRLPILWLSAAEALPAGLPMRGVRGWIGYLGGRSEQRFSYTLVGARRGYHQLGPTAVRTGDLFGLATRHAEGGGRSYLTVFPRIVPIQHGRFPSRRPAGEVRARPRVLEDPTLVVGIRPYQRGDGLRRVHWRATAHTGRLQSKLFEITAQIETTLILNLRRADYAVSPEQASDASELAIVTAASIARHVLDRRQRIGLIALARDPAGDAADDLVRVRPGRAGDQLVALLSVLGRAALSRGDSLGDVIRREKEGLAWGSLVIVITPAVDDQALSALLGLRTSGFEVSVVLVGKGAQLPADAAGLAAIGIRAWRVASEADIRELGI